MANKSAVNKFLLSWIVTTAVIFAFSLLFSTNVVLGNDKVNKVYAAVLAGLVVAVVNYFAAIYYKRLGLKVKDEYMAMIAYFLGDLVVIWVIKRFALTTGLGIANNLYVLILAVVIAVLKQGLDSPKLSFNKKKS